MVENHLLLPATSPSSSRVLASRQNQRSLNARLVHDEPIAAATDDVFGLFTTQKVSPAAAPRGAAAVAPPKPSASPRPAAVDAPVAFAAPLAKPKHSLLPQTASDVPVGPPREYDPARVHECMPASVRDLPAAEKSHITRLAIAASKEQIDLWTSLPLRAEMAKTWTFVNQYKFLLPSFNGVDALMKRGVGLDDQEVNWARLETERLCGAFFERSNPYLFWSLIEPGQDDNRFEYKPPASMDPGKLARLGYALSEMDAHHPYLWHISKRQASLEDKLSELAKTYKKTKRGMSDTVYSGWAKSSREGQPLATAAELFREAYNKHC